MGCDIHMVAEHRIDGVWTLVGKPNTDRGYTSMPSPYDGRNYDLFAILANVRNGVGFAGVDTGDGFVPIAMPRGIPTDACAEVREWSDDYGVDGHSHSWLTARELLDCDLTRTTKHRGWIDADNFAKWSGVGPPEHYCGGISGQRVRHMSNEEMRRRIADGESDPVNHYTLVEWTETYRESAVDFFDKTLPKLAEIGPPEDVRIVFFFDN